MRRFAVPLALVVGITAAGFAEEMPKLTMVIGLDFPTIGWVRYDQEGFIRGAWGFNFGLGVSSRNYTAKEGLQPEKLNFFWGWGTIAVIVPYIEFGITYPLLVNADKLFCLSAGGAAVFAGFFTYLAGYYLPWWGYRPWWVYPVPLVGFSLWL